MNHGGRSQPQPLPEIRSVRHDLRGRMNALVLCASALDDDLPPGEALEFISHIENTTDKLVALLDRLEELSE